MKVILKEDKIVKFSSTYGVDLLSPMPVGVGVERIRVVDGVPIDLSSLSQMWVRNLGGQQFELHAMELPGAQLVTMTYVDRRHLISEDGVIRVKTAQELEQDAIDSYNLLLKNQLRQDLSCCIGDEKEQIADTFKWVYLMIDFVLTGNAETKAALEEIKAVLDGIYQVSPTKSRLLDVATVLKEKIPDYYATKL